MRHLEETHLETETKMTVARGWGKGRMRMSWLMGERWTVVTGAQQCNSTSCH